MNTYIVSGLRTSAGKVTHVIVHQRGPAEDGGTTAVNVQELDAGELAQLVASGQVFVVRWDGGEDYLGSQVRIAGTRFVSVDKDGVENDDLMKLPQFPG